MREGDTTGAGYYFEGLDSTGGTVFPDALLDGVMAHLTGAEFKVLAYIVRRTLGFKRDSDTISLEQICGGVTRHDATPIDTGTGLSKKTAISALKGLEDKGVIIARKSTGRDSLPTVLALRHKGDAGPELDRPTGTRGRPGEERDKPGEERDKPGDDHDPGSVPDHVAYVRIHRPT